MDASATKACPGCKAQRVALQAIINALDAALDSAWEEDLVHQVSHARQIATAAILESPPVDTEPLGRLEIYSDTGVLLGMGDWRYTNSLNEIQAEPFTILEDGKASTLRIYMPNGTFGGESTIGLFGSGASTCFDCVDFRAGGTVVFPSITLQHQTSCPQCGYKYGTPIKRDK